MEFPEIVNFKFLNYFPILLVIICEILTSEVPRPRGVPLSRAPLYTPEENFACLDGSKVIPFTQVNDDYCDCPDASDEPGTSACPHGTFHCSNAGHRPQNIASSRVNDGICDCCDGSDESTNKRIKCPNTCLEMGRSAREEAQRYAELVKVGKQLRAELSQTGIQLKQEKKQKLTELQKNREEAVRVRTEKEEMKRQVEELENIALEQYRKIEEEDKQRKTEAENARRAAEAIETFQRLDTDGNGKVDVAEVQALEVFDADKNGEVSLEEAKSLLGNEDSVDLDQFVKDTYNNMKPYLMVEAGGVFQPPSTEAYEHEAEELAHEEPQEEEELEEDEDDVDQPEEHQEDVHPETTYDDETQKIVDQANAARGEHSEADKSVKDIEAEIRTIEEYLEKDFGPDEEFASLEGQCFDYTDHEYTYRLCPFDRAVQQPKSGSAETRLGMWGRWTGPQEDPYRSMLYERGQSCWNGPQRSSEVRLSCGSENRVTGVSEPNRCEYLFEFTTPAACRDAGEGGDGDVHDEL